MTVLDAGLIAVLLFFVAWGVWVGFIRQLIMPLSALLSFVVAGSYASQLQVHTAKAVSSPRVGFILAYLLLVVAVYLALRLLALGLRKVVNFSLTPWFDRILGGAMGGAKAYLLMILLFLAFSGASTPLTPLLQNSNSTPYLAAGARCLRELVRDQKLKEILTHHAPAISATAPIPGLAPP